VSGHASPEPFREACGLSGPLRLSVERLDGRPPEIREVAAPFAVIGRDPGADLVLDDPEVSRRHAYLQVVAGRAFLMDVGSRSGLFWGVDRRAEGWIDAGSAVRVGPYLVRPLLDGPEAPGDPLPDPTSRAFPMPGAVDVSLEIEGPEAAPGAWQVSRTLVLMGRSVACRLRLPGPNVSSLHACLVRTASGAWLVDLLSTSGTTVNGQPVRSAHLGEGDEVRIGLHRITVRPGVRGLATVGKGTPRAAPAGAAMASVVEEFARMQDQMTDQFQQALLGMLRLFGAMHQDQMALLREEMAQLRELSEEQRVLQGRLAASAPPAEDPAVRLRLVSGEGPANAPRSAAPDPPRPRPAPQAQDMHLMIEQRLAAIRGERQGRMQKLLSSVLGRGTDPASS